MLTKWWTSLTIFCLRRRARHSKNNEDGRQHIRFFRSRSKCIHCVYSSLCTAGLSSVLSLVDFCLQSRLMYRYILGSLRTLPFRAQSRVIGQARRVSQKTEASDEDIEVEYAAARKWVSDLKRETIPLNLAQISYARSSGAGGQHVNK